MNDKLVWVKADEGDWEDVKPVVIKALEAGADCILARPEHIESIRELGGATIASTKGGDIVLRTVDTAPDAPLPEADALTKDIEA
ncbi:MAG: 3-dehydroquinate synthase II, partial [Methermicoccaceae archaeon]